MKHRDKLKQQILKQKVLNKNQDLQVREYSYDQNKYDSDPSEKSASNELPEEPNSQSINHLINDASVKKNDNSDTSGNTPNSRREKAR